MFTTKFLNTICNNIFNIKNEPPLPTTYYLGLSSTAPKKDGTGYTEPTANDYHRVLINNLTEAIDGATTNSEIIAFTRSTTDWGKMTHYLIFGSDSKDNLLVYQEMPHSRDIEINTDVIVEPKNLIISTKSKEDVLAELIESLNIVD